MKETFINALKPGQAVDDVFVVRDKQLAHKKNGEPFLTFQICDRTGEAKAIAWSDVEVAMKQLAAGDLMQVAGKVNLYNGTLQVVVHRVSAVADPGRLAAEDFMPSVAGDIEEMFGRLIALADSITNKHLAELLAAFFRDAAFAEKFKKAPAAKTMHHAYTGGLLEHTLSIATLTQAVCAHYKGLERDLLLTGAILHDIGKIDELSYTTHIDYSDAGRLLSHIVIGVDLLEKKIQAFDSFPAELALLLKHMIVSHHGSREFGSPQPPMTLEAVALNFLDDLDAKIAGVQTFLKQEGPDSTWTSYHKLMDRFFYKGRQSSNGDKT